MHLSGFKWFLQEPQLLRVKGAAVAEADMGRMIDPYLLEDKDQPGVW